MIKVSYKGVSIDECDIEELIADTKKPEFEYGQNVYLKSGQHQGERFKFGCYTLDSEGAILLLDSGYAYSTVGNLSATPLKTKEEIELEEAKKKQVSEISGDLWRAGVMRYRSDIDPVIEYMQSAGFLAEILLPLESK